MSPVSKDIVSNLDDKLLVKAYFSDNLPPPYNNLRRQVQDILDDYRSYSDGNMNYEFLNPTSEGEGEGNELDKEAQAMKQSSKMKRRNTAFSLYRFRRWIMTSLK